MTERWQQAVVGETASIRDAMAAIDRGSIQMCLITDESHRLVGAITDGDIRRAILRGAALDTIVGPIMVKDPYTASVDTEEDVLARQMRTRKIRQIPLLDDDGRLVNVAYIDDVLGPTETHPNEVILMAGGRGTRLMPLTDETPKPMLEIGGRPILETIISRFVDQGFQCFRISLNYRGDMIRDYFGDGDRLGARIEYLYEDAPMGTAGALSLLETAPTAPVIVMNGDVLTQVDFRSLLAYHEEHDAAATMALREFGIQVPFGVVDVRDHRVTAISEKPKRQFLVNAGIYVLSGRALDAVPADEPSDMTDLFQILIDRDETVAAFPVHEYWTDVGRHDDLQKASEDYARVFE